MKVTWTLKNRPRPHIHANATELPQKNSLMRRKFIGVHKEPVLRPGGKPYCWRIPPCKRQNRPFGLTMYFSRFHALRLMDTTDPA
jgi:hypothetical protein